MQKITIAKFLSGLIILMIGAASVQAQVSINYSSGGTHYFTMGIADEWRVNVGSESDSALPAGDDGPPRVISAMPNDGVPLWFGMWVPGELEKIDDAETYWSSLGIDLLDEVAVQKREFDSWNTLNHYHVSGTGTKEGKTMDFHAAFIQLDPQHVAIAIYIGPREATMSYGEELNQMIRSLQPVTQ